MTVVATNRQARQKFELFDRYEAGIALKGSEVKSLREGRVNLKDSFVRIVRGEAFLFNCHISPYSHIQNILLADPTRMRKLLLKRNEIDRLGGQTSRKGHTLVPLSIYFKKGRAKVEIAVARGKREYDKRETLRRRIAEREAERAIKRRKS
jgi:SsrA-binding protein